MKLNNAFYAQSGGSTAVINTSAAGVIAACQAADKITKIFVGRNGIMGALNNDLLDLTDLDNSIIKSLCHTPASAFGSCRHKLKGEMNDPEMAQIFKTFKDNQIGYFFYNGGNDSQDTILKISRYAEHHNYPLICIGIPKTIDNDLACTDHCPGYPSAAKFLATITQEVALELRGMSHSSSKVFIMEAMGRNAGWLAAACAYPAITNIAPPHITLFPERLVDIDNLLMKTEQVVKDHGYCMIVASEGARGLDGQLLAQSKDTDEFGHHQLGGIGFKLKNLIEIKLGLKSRSAAPDYIQRSSRHLAASLDVEQAYELGAAAVQHATSGANGVMLTIVRDSNNPYKWHIGEAQLSSVANTEKTLPDKFIRADGYGITKAFQDYLRPLITGEDYPPYKDGIPDYIGIYDSILDRSVVI
jgi:6-phosphofructokinase